MRILPATILRLLLTGLVGGWLGGPSPGTAQPVQRLETGFEREVNRYRWSANLAVAQRVGRWEVALTNRFLSDAFILFEDQLSFRDEDQFVWQAGRGLGERFAVHLHGQAAWFSLSRVFNQTTYAGLRYQVRPSAWVEPMVGVAFDRRPGIAPTAEAAPLRLDAGPAFGVRIAVAPVSVGGYRLQAQGEGKWEVIQPRRGRAVRLLGQGERSFEGTRLTSAVRLSSFRRDVYQAASFLNRNTDRLAETIEATNSDTLIVTFTLDAPVISAVRLSSRLDVSANNRFIRTLGAPNDALFFDSDFNRRTFDAELGLRLEKPALTTHLAIRGGAEIERRSLANDADLPPVQAAQTSDLLQQADYDRGYVTLLARARAMPTSRMAFSFDGSASVLRHDTPEINPDDRDELFYRGSLGALYRISRYLQADVQLFGTYFHTVYLKATRSAENNVQRSLRLRPALQWTPARHTRVRLSSEVRATYTVDDFVLPGRRPTDQSAREVRYDLEAERDFGGGLWVRSTGSLSDLRLGRFLEDQFAEIPFDTLRTYSGWLRVQAGQRLTAEVGLRFFIRSDFDRAATVRYDRLDAEGNVVRDETGAVLRNTITRPGRTRIEQVGPTCALTWPMRNGSALRFDGWFTVQHIRNRLYGDLPEASADQIRRAARRGTHTLIPNLAVTMVWNF